MKVARPCSTSAAHVHHTAALIRFNHPSRPLYDSLNSTPDYPSVTCIISLPLFLLSSSPQLHVARSVSQWVRPSGASGPLRLRPPPQLSKAETRHCGHAILAAVVGFRQPAFEQNTDGVTDTWEQKRGNGLISSAAARREQWTSRWQGHSLEFMRCSSSPCPFLRA